MTASSKVLSVALALSLILLVPRVSNADPKQLAREAFLAGVQNFQQGNYAAALEQFQKADGLAHSPAITYNVARAFEKLERPQEAVAAYEAYVAEAGEGGEFTNPAVVAIAQIKARSSRLSIDSTPPGAHVTLDGIPLSQRTPVRLLVARGSHRVAIELDGWSETREYEATGGGSSGQLVFVRSEAARQPVPSAPAKTKSALPLAAAPAPVAKRLDGLTGSAGISLSAYRFLGSADERSSDGATTADSTPRGLIFGLAFDAGYALSSRTALLLRLFGGLGSAEEAIATIGAAGPVITHRLSSRWWTGGGIVVGAGRAEADASTTTTQNSSAILDSQITFKTNFALGPTLELSYALDVNDNGHWLASLAPSVLVTTTSRESTLIVPLMLGYRWF